MTNRVVITGYGVVSAIGNSPEEFWNNLKAGKTGIGPITHFDAEATGISVYLHHEKIFENEALKSREEIIRAVISKSID